VQQTEAYTDEWMNKHAERWHIVEEGVIFITGFRVEELPHMAFPSLLHVAAPGCDLFHPFVGFSKSGTLKNPECIVTVQDHWLQIIQI